MAVSKCLDTFLSGSQISSTAVLLDTLAWFWSDVMGLLATVLLRSLRKSVLEVGLGWFPFGS